MQLQPTCIVGTKTAIIWAEAQLLDYYNPRVSWVLKLFCSSCHVGRKVLQPTCIVGTKTPVGCTELLLPYYNPRVSWVLKRKL